MRWTITYSVLAGYLILVILLLGTNVLLSWRVGTLDREDASLLHTPKLDAIGSMLEGLRVQMHGERFGVLADSGTVAGEQVDLARAGFLRELAGLEELDWDTQGRASLARVRKLYAELDSLAAAAQQHASGGREGTASAPWMYRSRMEPLQRELEGVLWELREQEGRLEQLKGVCQLVRRSLASVTLLAAVLGIGVAVITTLQVSRPLRSLAQAARRLGEGRLGYQVPVESDDEVGTLARAFNEMSVRLERLDRFRSEFISNVSHELRTPLVSIQQAVSLLRDGVPGPLNDHQEDLLDIVRANQQRLKKLIEGMLDISRLEADEMVLQFQKTGMLELAEECVREIEPLAAQGGIRMEIVAPEKLGEVWVDQERIKQVMINLLGNAVKFTPNGGRITVRLWEEDAALRCDVADTGPGIPSGELEAIFDKFYQVRQEKDRKTEGTGLGLAISRGIISVHNGRIWATSTLGKGATFSFSLPKPQPGQRASEETRGEGQNTHR